MLHILSFGMLASFILSVYTFSTGGNLINAAVFAGIATLLAIAIRFLASESFADTTKTHIDVHHQTEVHHHHYDPEHIHHDHRTRR